MDYLHFEAYVRNVSYALAVPCTYQRMDYRRLASFAAYSGVGYHPCNSDPDFRLLLDNHETSLAHSRQQVDNRIIATINCSESATPR